MGGIGAGRQVQEVQCACMSAAVTCLDRLELVLEHAPEALVEAVLLPRKHKGVGLQPSPRLLQVLSFGQYGVPAQGELGARLT